LTQADATIVGRNLMMGKHAKAAIFQLAHRPRQEKFVLKDSTA
jgi:hypothetical protein